MIPVVLVLLFADASGAAPGAPPDWHELRRLAQLSDSRGDYSTGKALLVRAEALAQAGSASDHFVALEDLGNHYVETRDFPSAARWFRTALTEQSHAPAGQTATIAHALALDNLGSALRRMDHFEEAEPFEQEAARAYASLRMTAEAGHCHAALAEIALALGNSAKTKTELKTATELLAGSSITLDAARTLVWVAQMQLAAGQIEDASAILGRADVMMTRLQPVPPSERIALKETRGALLFRRRHYAEAERLWQDVLRQTPPGSVLGLAVRLHLGQLYNNLGQYRDAEPFLREVLAQPTTDPIARGMSEAELGRSFMREHHNEPADELFRSAIAELENSGMKHMLSTAVVYGSYANLRMQQKRWGEALPFLQRAISIGRSVGVGGASVAVWLLDCETIYKKLGKRKAAADCKAQARALLAQMSTSPREVIDVRELQAQRN